MKDTISTAILTRNNSGSPRVSLVGNWSQNVPSQKGEGGAEGAPSKEQGGAEPWVGPSVPDSGNFLKENILIKFNKNDPEKGTHLLLIQTCYHVLYSVLTNNPVTHSRAQKTKSQRMK